MQATVRFGSHKLEVQVEPDRLIDAVSGPQAMTTTQAEQAIASALSQSISGPSLAESVVPGDHVAIVVELGTPELGALVRGVIQALGRGGVTTDTITVLVAGTPPGPEALPFDLPEGVRAAVHKVGDRSAFSYLGLSAAARRIDLNRIVTDADVVVAIGVVGFDRGQGLRGPWSVVYPGLSDRPSHEALRAEIANQDQNLDPDESEISDEPPRQPAPFLRPREARRLAFEVSRQLGSQFQVGVLAAAEGLAGVLAGETGAVFAATRQQVEALWRFGLGRLAEVVVAGIGVSWQPTSWADLARGLRAAAACASPRGSIVVLTELSSPPGPAVTYLAQQFDPHEGPTLLRGRRDLPDFWIAKRLASVVSSHRVYLHAPGLDPELVEDLGFIPVARPEQAQRIISSADSCIVLSPAERFRPYLIPEDEA